MRHRYIILVGSIGQPEETEAALAEIGMQLRLSSGRTRLFSSNETPVLFVEGGGAIVGDLFNRDGTAINDGAQLPALPDRTQLRQFILENYWGDYLLVQPEAEDGGALTCLRDPSPAGDLSCIYSVRHDSGFIASDISLPIQLGLYTRNVDWDFIAHCLAYPHLKLGRTGLTGIHELLPGCALRIDGVEASLVQEWSPWRLVSPKYRHTNSDEAAAEIRSAVQSVVAAWASADKSILLELSGGLDSSILGVCLRETSARVVCCTLTASVPGADERQYAGLIAKALGAQLETQELRVEDAQFAFAQAAYSVTPRIGLLQYAVDEIMETVASRHGVNSFFSGSGGDTAFCYLATAAPAADALRARGLIAGAATIQDLSELHQCTLWKAGRLAIWKLMRAPRPPCSKEIAFLPPNKIPENREDHPWFAAPAGALAGDRERIFDLAGNQIFRDSSPRGKNRRLRMPLLSQPVVEACLKTPSWMWISGGRNRAIARAAFADKLPQEILNRRSKGNFVSYLGSTYRRNRHQMLGFLLTGQLQAHGLLESDSLRHFVDNDLPPRDRSFMRIFDLCMIENWARHQS